MISLQYRTKAPKFETVINTAKSWIYKFQHICPIIDIMINRISIRKGE